MDVSIEYISAACNQVPHTVALNKNDTSLIYGACNSIIQVEIKNDRMVAKKAFIGHTDRVNCVRWTGNQSFVTGGTDKKVCLWENFNVIQVRKTISSHITQTPSFSKVLFSSSFLGTKIFFQIFHFWGS